MPRKCIKPPRAPGDPTHFQHAGKRSLNSSAGFHTERGTGQSYRGIGQSHRGAHQGVPARDKVAGARHRWRGRIARRQHGEWLRRRRQARRQQLARRDERLAAHLRGAGEDAGEFGRWGRRGAARAPRGNYAIINLLININ